MWFTNIEHDEKGVSKIVNIFGNNVKIIVDLRENVIKRFHGEICVEEFSADISVGNYMQYLSDLNDEINRFEPEHEFSNN